MPEIVSQPSYCACWKAAHVQKLGTTQCKCTVQHPAGLPRIWCGLPLPLFSLCLTFFPWKDLRPDSGDSVTVCVRSVIAAPSHQRRQAAFHPNCRLCRVLASPPAKKKMAGSVAVSAGVDKPPKSVHAWICMYIHNTYAPHCTACCCLLCLGSRVPTLW